MSDNPLISDAEAREYVETLLRHFPDRLGRPRGAGARRGRTSRGRLTDKQRAVLDRLRNRCHGENAGAAGMTLDELKLLCERATPGPWRPLDAYECGGGSHPKDDRCVHVARLGAIVADGGGADLNGPGDDFQFVCAARTFLPALIAVAEAGEAVAANCGHDAACAYIMQDTDEDTEIELKMCDCGIRALVDAVAALRREMGQP